MKEEILLLEMSLSFKRKWANISQFLPGRTQHSIKNQFLSIMIKHLEVPRSKLLQILKRKTLEDEILECLKALKAKK